MENSSARIVKQTNQNLCFGLVVKVSKSWLFIVLVLMPKSLLACRGGYNSWRPPETTTVTPTEDPEFEPKPPEDPESRIDLGGTRDLLERNVKTGHDGWQPSVDIEKQWRHWYATWKNETEKNEKISAATLPGRGKGSAFPDLLDWEGLGIGNPGDDIPPWGYIPINYGRPSVCYLPPVRGDVDCPPRMEFEAPEYRYGFNPYADECQKYFWTGCAGTRNRFITKAKCEEHCKYNPPPSCT